MAGTVSPVAVRCALERISMSPEQGRSPDAEFAFPVERKKSLNGAAYVRCAIARFDQVRGVTDPECDAARERINGAADEYGVYASADDWRDRFSRRGSERRGRG
jgi:hypothetical protein